MSATEMSCPGGGKAWTVDVSGKAVCPRCKRSFTTLAGRHRTVSNMPKVPEHTRPKSQKVPRQRG
ncbi:hypothetical protein [Mycolicibacterium arenosum]|uniref:Uncharacterized protein n=1 Tax=Mycolicibacterium arenosum TaxID=2952157 RepID=A0ABT1LVD1_9MYCO|nr:hypothetical protein [Mycolicibacterium sp. CAU 1645]MCP9270864.1 hypothetical protein [Mycolicibacterium sp. CAU 1645]